MFTNSQTRARCFVAQISASENNKKKYKEIEIIEDEISEDKLKIYLENIREKANQENTIDSNEMKDKFFQKLCELDTQKKQRNL